MSDSPMKGQINTVTLHTWNKAKDITSVQQLVSRLWPRSTHPGGLGWEAASDQLPQDTMLAKRDGEVVGWAGVTGGELIVQAEPNATSALLEWAVGVAQNTALRIAVFDGDEVLRTLVLEAGFIKPLSDEPLVGMFRPATVEEPVLPDGYRIRSMHDGEEAERVAVHRASWHPATLPWPEDDLLAHTISPDTTSRFTAVHFEQVRQTWLYNQKLDLVVEAPDGTLTACCTAWRDPATGCAEIEPLGVIPEHRRKGLASALCMEVCTQVARQGGDQVFINTWPRDDYPAPAATYLTIGFVVTRRGSVYHRPAQ